jgi:hypothetical protein
MSTTSDVVRLRPKEERPPRWFGKVGQRLENVPVTVVHIYVFFHADYPQFMVKMTRPRRAMFWSGAPRHGPRCPPAARVCSPQP